MLDELRRAQPGFRLAERWRDALDARRIGRVALRSAPAEGVRLAAGFWLDAQRPVWVRTANVDAAERLAREATLQRTLALPGIALVVEDGVASGSAYVAVAADGEPLVVDADLRPATALATAAAVTRILRALALTGVSLPDAAPERFLRTHAPAFGVVLADLDGATTSDAAATQNAAAARTLVDRLVTDATVAELPDRTRAALVAARADAAARARRRTNRRSQGTAVVVTSQRRDWVKLPYEGKRARRGAREVSSAGVAELRRAAQRPSNEVWRRKLAQYPDVARLP